VILVDSNPLIALVDPRDDLNERATADLVRLRRQRLVVVAPVLTEVCFALPHPHQRARLRQLLLRFSIQPWPAADDAALWAEVFAWLDRYADHDPDFADGYLAIACSLDRRLKLWTYDKEFRTTWRRADGSRIPLAADRR
jgi:predicted nucleic acid-binding protein